MQQGARNVRSPAMYDTVDAIMKFISLFQSMKQYINGRVTISSRECFNMRNMQSKFIRNLSFVLLTILLFVVTLIAFMTYHPTENANKYLTYAVQHHTIIMAGLLGVALVFGFFFSQLFYAEIQRKSQDSKSILAVVLLFLNQEERAIVNFLVQNKGLTTQAEIARLPHMNRVKAHRSLQKMQEKQLIELVAHGKVRKVQLKENILQLLLEEQK
jgi:uncharacterized membrane protein